MIIRQLESNLDLNNNESSQLFLREKSEASFSQKLFTSLVRENGQFFWIQLPNLEVEDWGLPESSPALCSFQLIERFLRRAWVIAVYSFEGIVLLFSETCLSHRQRFVHSIWMNEFWGSPESYSFWRNSILNSEACLSHHLFSWINWKMNNYRGLLEFTSGLPKFRVKDYELIR